MSFQPAWDDLRVVLALVRTQSPSSAAEVLNSTPADVIGHLDALEAYLGIRLFDRRSSTVIPTELCSRLVDSLGAMEHAANHVGEEMSTPEVLPLAPEIKLELPRSGIIDVAFVVSADATLIDIVGPMQTFDQVQSMESTGFRTYTISESRQPIKAGTLTVVPDYAFDETPHADIVVVGAQSGGTEPYLNYIRNMASQGKLMLSICTGVSKFAAAGLLDGLCATSHHDFIDQLQERFPRVRFVRSRAYVHSAPNIYTAGGETSGIELALHIIELYFDHTVATKTARYMEYRGPAWQQ